ncbi:MAG: cache domain-containing protein [Elusimicrobiales bacterium]|nr:cache domain-containing protein [Elusimicrobiales bacterium]
MNGLSKYKFTAAVAGLFLLPFLLLSRHFIYGEGELQKNDTLRYLGLRTSTGAGIISDVLNLNYNLARVAGARLSGGQAALKKDLAARAQENPFIYSELALLGPSGAELARYPAGGSKPRLEYAKSPVFSEAKATLAPAGAVEYGEYTPPALVLAEPLLKGGSPAYYLAGRLSLAYLGEVVRMMGRNSYGSFGLVDMGGQVIADSMSMSIVKPGLKAPAEVLKLLALASERETADLSSPVYFRGRTLLVSVSNVAGTKWWVYEVMDAGDAPARRASSWAWRVVTSGVLLILLFSIVAYKLAAYWLKPSQGESGTP